MNSAQHHPMSSAPFQQNVEKPSNPIGASSAQGATLKGLFATAKTYQPSFALIPKSLQEITIPPHQNASLGPIYFRPTSRDFFDSEIFIENSFTGLEKVTIRGQGGFEK